MTALMSIGEFALATGLSAKALRFYDERGLLTPVDVDPHSGYRHYAPRQVRTAADIRVLRATGFTVEDVKAALADPDRLPALLDEHVETLRRRRDLEDRALEIARAQHTVCDAPRVQERTAEATAWVGVLLRLDVADIGDDAATDRANEAFAAVWTAAAEAGLESTAPLWSAVRPAAGRPDVVEMVLAVPVAGAVPTSFAVEGWETVTGLLPCRVERFVSFRAEDPSVDLLEDAPGGPLPHPALLDLMDAFDGDASQDADFRQILVDPKAGHIELAVTVREIDG